MGSPPTPCPAHSDTTRVLLRLYRQVAEDRAVQSSRRPLRLPVDEQFATAARAVGEAAGALAVIASFYTDPDSELDGSLAQLLAIAVGLEHTGDATPATPPDRRTC